MADIRRRLFAAVLACLLVSAHLLTAAPLAAQTTTPQPDPTADSDSVRLPYAWEGDATVAAAELAAVAPPLEAIPAAGDFTISYLPADDGDVLRVLPAGSTLPGQLELVWRLDAATTPPLPAGAIVTLTLAAHTYAPSATARAFIADDTGRSSVELDSLTWREATVTRRIVPDASEVRIGVEWGNVPGNGWLEVRDLQVDFAADDAGVTLSPTDVPATPTAAVVLPTPTATPTVLLEPPTPTPLPTPTLDLIIVTATPTPADVFEEATRVAQATEQAIRVGTATPTPDNLVTPTFTPSPIVVTPTPAPGNAATATHVALYATAVAATTGTPTPLPPGAVVVIATPEAAAQPAAQAQPTRTPTPIYVLLEDVPTPTILPTPAMPEELIGKILFLSDYRGNPRQPNAMVINPDGTGVGILTSNQFYTRAAARDRYSADKRFHVYSLHEAGGEAHNAGPIQIFYDDAHYQSTHHQLTYFGSGTAWAPTWSPKRDVIALVSNDTGNDEIWLVQPDRWPAVQVTHNEWEWDHHPSFSPDGDQIVFSSNRGGGQRQLWIMDSDGSNERQLTFLPFEAWDPVWVKYPDS